MTKINQTEKHLSLSVIEQHAAAIDAALKKGVAARDALAAFGRLKGESVRIASAVVIKKIVRDEFLRLLVAPVDSPLEVFAEITDEREAAKITDWKVRKGSAVAFTGEIISFGCAALNLTNCQFKELKK